MRTLSLLRAGLRVTPKALHPGQTHIKARGERHKRDHVTVYAALLSPRPKRCLELQHRADGPQTASTDNPTALTQPT